MKRENFKSFDGKVLSLCVWDTVEHPVGAVQIVHGMAEHMLRYDNFAQFMNGQGFIVVGDDHRGHGETDKDALGINSDEGDLFRNVMRDSICITRYLKEKYSLPVIVLGHSYGSFITQARILEDTTDLNGVIIMGSAFMTGLQLTFGNMLAARGVKKGREKDPAYIFAKMTFNSYEKKTNEGRGAWLTRDKDIVKSYIGDPLSGFVCSYGFYSSFFSSLKRIAKADYSKADKSLKMMIVSGSRDHVGGCGKLVTKLHKNYLKNGFTPFLKLYENARHEILNETNREDVYNDIAGFVKACL